MKYNIFFILALFFIPATIYAQSTCFECHGESDFIGEKEGKERSLYVVENVYKQSVHGDFECVDCHVDANGDPHPEDLNDVNCGMCHEEDWQDFFKGAHGQLVQSGDANAPTCASCHSAHDIKSAQDSTSRTYALNLPQTCGECHKKEGVATHRNITIDSPMEHYLRGVHGQALATGNKNAASCDDCHEAHLSLPKSNPESKIFRFNISATCGKCHQDIQHVYDESIHGVSLKQGEFMSATCINCHEAHEILSASNPDSPTHPLNAPDKICAPCHSVERLNERYGFTENVFESYKDSYHGLATRRGSVVAANCNDCHGVHNIKSKTDSTSSTFADNVQQTCAKCHRGASSTFAQSYVHSRTDAQVDRFALVLKSIYIYLIIVVIGGMVIHNLIIWFAYVRAKYKAMKVQQTIQRFDKAWIFQHITNIITFTLLVITGFALKYPEAGWARLLTFLGLTEMVRGTIHRVAAVGMIIGFGFQMYYLFFVKSWKGELQSLLPSIIDLRQFIQNMSYHLGITKKRPQFHRYGYIEKAEYWALVWGTVVMAMTGLVLWFPEIATKFLPSWIVKVSETIHFYEAILASLAILLYHMFFAIFHPEDYPINLTGFTGKIPEEEAKERFPMWYKKLSEQKDKNQ